MRCNDETAGGQWQKFEERKVTVLPADLDDLVSMFNVFKCRMVRLIKIVQIRMAAPVYIYMNIYQIHQSYCIHGNVRIFSMY